MKTLAVKGALTSMVVSVVLVMKISLFIYESTNCISTQRPFILGYVRVFNRFCKARTREFAKAFVADGNSILMTNLDGT
jgi:hypothetical protein